MTGAPTPESPTVFAVPSPAEALGTPFLHMGEVVSAEFQAFTKTVLDELSAEVLAGADLGPLLVAPMNPLAAMSLYNQTLIRRMNLALGLASEVTRLWSGVGAAVQGGYGGLGVLWPPKLA